MALEGISVRSTWDEVNVSRYLNALVEKQVCPNLPLLHDAFVGFHDAAHTKPIGLTLIMECSPGNAVDWLQATRRSTNEIMSLIFQCCAAIALPQLVLGVFHNDIKLGNVLHNELCKDTVLEYQIGPHTYFVPTDALFKLADWGMAYGGVLPPFDTRVHDGMRVQSFVHPDLWEKHYKKVYTQGVVHVQGTPLAKGIRDYAMLFYGLLAEAHVRGIVGMPTSYVRSALAYVTSPSTRSASQHERVNVFATLFSTDFWRPVDWPNGARNCMRGKPVPRRIMCNDFDGRKTHPCQPKKKCFRICPDCAS